MRRALPLLLLAHLSVGAQASPAGQLPQSIRILDPQQVLDERSRTLPDGLLYLEDREGVLRPFVLTTDDPRILNPGDGTFHPSDPAIVEEALVALDPRFLGGLRFDVYVLPFPVDDPMSSWAGIEALYLSPGVYPLTRGQVHNLVAHEAGHLAQRTFLPDSDIEGWRAYRILRGIEDESRYSAGSAHRDRPHEIFAEDFRVLFGGHLAAASGIENFDLADPRSVPGLADFLIARTGAQPAIETPALASGVSPNPVRVGGGMTLSLPGVAGAGAADLVDVRGRVVRRLDLVAGRRAGSLETIWDGLDGSGRRLARGVYFCRVRTLDGPPVTLRFVY